MNTATNNTQLDLQLVADLVRDFTKSNASVTADTLTFDMVKDALQGLLAASDEDLAGKVGDARLSAQSLVACLNKFAESDEQRTAATDATEEYLNWFLNRQYQQLLKDASLGSSEWASRELELQVESSSQTKPTEGTE